MDIYFQDPADIPLPPDEVRIRELSAEPYPDHRRVRIVLKLTPFQKRPNCEIGIKNEAGDTVTSLSIIESIDPKMEFTVHLKPGEPNGKFTLFAEIYYYIDESVAGEPDSSTPAKEHQLPAKIEVVDRQQILFIIGDELDNP
ncbi:MAG: hypothetical protein JSV42_04165 [Chloroflexota bacterium]|nr:MAG: hypothetical protein JSV42_04165 [Chloroflexota bacterium]